MDLATIIERLASIAKDVDGTLEAARALQAGAETPRVGRVVQACDLQDAFLEDDLIELGAAAQSFETEKDTLRLWCRTKRIGVKRAGRWLVSRSKLRELLGR